MNSYIYLIKNETTGNLKIGQTNNVSRRFEQLERATDCQLKLLTAINGTKDDEEILLAKFKDYHIKNEWHYPHPDILEYFDIVT